MKSTKNQNDQLNFPDFLRPWRNDCDLRFKLEIFNNDWQWENKCSVFYGSVNFFVGEIMHVMFRRIFWNLGIYLCEI